MIHIIVVCEIEWDPVVMPIILWWLLPHARFREDHDLNVLCYSALADRRHREQRRYRSSDQNQQDDPEDRPHGDQGQGQREERERRRREDQGRHAGQDRRRESQGGAGRPSSDRSQSRPQHQHDAAQRTDRNRVHREDLIPISLDRYNPDRPYDGRQVRRVHDETAAQRGEPPVLMSILRRLLYSGLWESRGHFLCVLRRWVRRFSARPTIWAGG